MVWKSSKESLAKNEVSFLAIVEIFIAVFIYWYIAYCFDFYWHLIISIALSPLLLFQTEKSSNLSLQFMYDSYDKVFINKIVTSIFFVIQILLIIAAYLFSSYMFRIIETKTPDISSQYLIMAILGIGIVFGIFMTMPSDETKNEEVGKAKSFIALLFENLLFLLLVFSLGIGMGIGILMITTMYKFFSVCYFIKDGYKGFIENWFFHLFVIDSKKIPEIIPGIEAEKNIRNIFKLSKLYELLKKSDSFLQKIMAFILFLTLYPLSLVYRLSIKSTFWFYLPLLFVVRTPNLESSPKIGKFLSELYQTYNAKVRLILALMTLIAFTFTYFNFYDFKQISSNPFASYIALLYFDFSSLELWKVFQIIVAVITIGLFFYANEIREPIVNNGLNLENDSHVKTIFYLNHFRNWISLFYFISAFLFLAYHFQIWHYEYVPKFMEVFLIYSVHFIQFQPFQ